MIISLMILHHYLRINVLGLTGLFLLGSVACHAVAQTAPPYVPYILSMSDTSWENLALHAPYIYEPVARYPYTAGDSDSIELTDGKYTHRHFWTSQDTTVGWLDPGTIHIEIDLLSSYEIGAISLNTARGEKAGVSFPNRVDIFVSSDGSNYLYLGDLFEGDSHSDGPYQIKKFQKKYSATARYVSFYIEPNGSYTFVDEVQVLGTAQKSESNDVYLIKKSELAKFHKDLVESEHYFSALQYALGTLDYGSAVTTSTEDGELNELILQIRELEAAGVSYDKEELKRLVYAFNTELLSRRFNEKLLIWHQNPWMPFSSFALPSPEQLLVKPLKIDLLRFGVSSEAFVVTNNSLKSLHYNISVNGHINGPKIAVKEAKPILLASREMRADPLIEFHDNSFSLEPGESKQIWISIESREAASGNYVANIEISEDGAGVHYLIPLEMNVSEVELSAEQSLMVNTWAYLTWRPISHIPEKAIEDLILHHSNVAILHPSQVPWPIDYNAAVSTIPNFSKFDTFINQSFGADRFLFYLGFNTEGRRNLLSVSPFMSENWRKLFTQWINDWSQHILEQGLSYEDFAFYPFDEPDDATEANYLIDTAKLIKEINPHLKVYTTLDLGGRVSRAHIEKLAQYIDTFQVPINQSMSSNALYLKSLGKEIWTYGSGKKSTDPIDFYRLQSWRAFKNEVTGIGLWAYADTGNSGVAWNDLDGNRPDYSAIYEGEGEVITSKRWEAWKEGVEDYCLLKLAKNKIHSKDEKDEFERRVDGVLENPSDYEVLQGARRFFLQIASRVTGE